MSEPNANKTIGGFDIDDIYLKPQSTIKDKTGKPKWFLLVAYIDAHTIFNYLDKNYGAENWSFDWQLVWGDGKSFAVKGQLTINGLTKTDGGDGETIKEAVSDAVKRAYHQHPDSNRFLWFQRQVFIDKEQCEALFKKGRVSLAQLGGKVNPETMQLTYDIPQIEASPIPSIEDWEKEFELADEEGHFDSIMNRLRPLWEKYNNDEKKKLKEVKDRAKSRIMPLGRFNEPNSQAEELDKSLLGDPKNAKARAALMASCTSKKLKKVVVSKEEILDFINSAYGRHLEKKIESRNEIPMYLVKFISAFIVDTKAQKEEEA